MLYVIIGAVIIFAIICIFSFKGKNGKIADYKVQEENAEEEQTTSSIELNEETDSGMTLKEEDFNFDDPLQVNKKFDDEPNIDFNQMFNDYDAEYGDYSSDFDFGEFESQEDDKKRSDIVNEIHRMSPKMKAILLGDVLDRKHF
ncbi:MAG: hypothetical protein IJZ29_04455 [Clostridia bacterium]|nr:hypothetical protein [Clostridia bacterium]